MKQYHIYILASLSKTLYVGVTGDLMRRVLEHKNGLVRGFTSKYRVSRLVHLEEFRTAYEAITREKQIKGWLRAKKLALIEADNPEWEDLSSGWYDEQDSSLRSE